jgi:rhodanese-related sulfurtransferase
MSIRHRIAASFVSLFAIALLTGCQAGPEVKSQAPAPQTVAAPKTEVKKAGPVLPKGVSVITTDDLKALVDKGIEAGNYLLFDSRPAGRFHAATIPTSQNLTDAELAKLDQEGKVVTRLGADKNKQLIFWCGGPT